MHELKKLYMMSARTTSQTNMNTIPEASISVTWHEVSSACLTGEAGREKERKGSKVRTSEETRDGGERRAGMPGVVAESVGQLYELIFERAGPCRTRRQLCLSSFS